MIYRYTLDDLPMILDQLELPSEKLTDEKRAELADVAVRLLDLATSIVRDSLETLTR